MHFSIIYLNSKNIDPKFESSFANKLSLQSRFWACNARFFSTYDQSIASTKIKYIKLNTKTHELCFLNLTLYDISLLGIEKHILFVCYLEKNIVKPLVHKTTNSTKEKI